ncbi:helix-turn-helix domain-containing protein [Paludibacterium yongneupense]|uniref:helix-turn-helix domain-containing protein n=1 Tax=Paludibacterium yongneupense TaxID=400061 RepID=UPI0003FBEEAE|nr:AraC family transcriptional regulator [Paludibacterium yongneupense]
MSPVSFDYPVFQRLSHSRANLEHALCVGDGMAIAVWNNRHDAVHYAPPGHHTLSLYLEGGYGTFRRDRAGERGAPGRLCLLSDEEDSEWVINGPLRFLHLYIPPAVLSAHALALADLEPRELELARTAFFDDAELAGLLRPLLALPGSDPDAHVAGNALAHETVARLIGSHARRRHAPRLSGGLAPAVRRRLTDWLDAHLDQPLTLGSMAREAHLSEFHFARMFRRSFGVPPQVWLHTRRIARARQLLEAGALPLTSVALACGFASASHFSNRFRQATGVSPSRYRTLKTGKTA